MKDSLNNIKIAEAITGKKMAGPTSPEELAKSAFESQAVGYYMATDDDEDEDTKETRKSIEMAERMLKRKFSMGADKEDEIEVAKSAVNERIVIKDLEMFGIGASVKAKKEAEKIKKMEMTKEEKIEYDRKLKEKNDIIKKKKHAAD